MTISRPLSSLFNRKIAEHYDDAGSLIGFSRKGSWIGGKVLEHFDAAARPAGFSRRGGGPLFSRRLLTHFDAMGQKIGYSKSSGFSGVIRHFNAASQEIGYSRRQKGWFWAPKSLHVGSLPLPFLASKIYKANNNAAAAVVIASMS